MSKASCEEQHLYFRNAVFRLNIHAVISIWWPLACAERGASLSMLMLLKEEVLGIILRDTFISE